MGVYLCTKLFPAILNAVNVLFFESGMRTVSVLCYSTYIVKFKVIREKDQFSIFKALLKTSSSFLQP